MRLRILAASFALLAITLTAKADTLFSVNATTENGYSLLGSVSINTNLGTISSENLTYKLGNSIFVFSGTPYFQATTDHDYFWDIADTLGNVLQLSVPPLSLVNYAGGSLCSTAASCSGYVGGFLPVTGSADFFVSGALTATPEPSSLALLGTGILGLAGMVRRRMA